MIETTARPEVTTADLEALGFNDEQITKLEALRADYPLIEFVESNQQLNQLRFLRWLHSQDRDEQ